MMTNGEYAAKYVHDVERWTLLILCGTLFGLVPIPGVAGLVIGGFFGCWFMSAAKNMKIVKTNMIEGILMLFVSVMTGACLRAGLDFSLLAAVLLLACTVLLVRCNFYLALLYEVPA